MELKKTSLDYIRNRAWECADHYVHLASDGHETWHYPNIRSRNAYILDPWQGDMDRNPSVENPEKVYGWEKMDLFYAVGASKWVSRTFL